jgi:2-C-methyl-D-erythritol 4-phosphate cytidylyltransferase/2-C-methyl-D-erythritol 2,4-cyclodiphosphate synthase
MNAAEPSTIAAVIVAAGAGLRAGQPIPKQFANWRGKPVLRHSVETLLKAIGGPIVVAIPDGCEDIVCDVLAGLEGWLAVSGGDTRQDSVAVALGVLEAFDPHWVMIHDAARPIITLAVLDRLRAALGVHRAAIPVLPVADSLAQADGELMGAAAPRETLRRVQTPQAFEFGSIVAAHRAWTGARDAGDDAQVARAAGIAVALVEGDEALHKLTYAADFAATAALQIRVGTGYDVHRLAAGEELWLGGVRIEHSHGLSGHSDADVVIHALVDAILGAIGAGDIGSHFPPSDAQWRGASSDRFLNHALGLAAEAGYQIGNVDLTIICEAPRIGPHRAAMRTRLAQLMNCSEDRVSIKATTTERLGFTGRGEGIAAQAAATLVLS